VLVLLLYPIAYSQVQLTKYVATCGLMEISTMAIIFRRWTCNETTARRVMNGVGIVGWLFRLSIFAYLQHDFTLLYITQVRDTGSYLHYTLTLPVVMGILALMSVYWFVVLGRKMLFQPPTSTSSISSSVRDKKLA